MKELKRALLTYVLFSVLTGIIYPLLMTGVSQVFFPYKANGSLLQVKERIVGSELIGQSFTKPEYFHGRPSAVNYDAKNSGATNWGPTNQKLINQVDSTANKFRYQNGLPTNAVLPADIVTSSSSGLDPHITLSAALLQVPRVAKVRGLKESVIYDLVNQYTEKPFWGMIGQPIVNVLEINIALNSIKKE